MKRSTLILLAVLAFVPFGTGVSRAESRDIVWRKWDAGLREANNSNRPVLVDVYTDWCGWCRRMERDVYARPDVREYLASKFVTVKLDAEDESDVGYEGKSLSSRSLASRFRVTGYPTTVFLRANGEHLVNVPGYVEGDRFLSLLQYIGEGEFDRGVSFSDFVKRKGASPPAKKK